MVIAINTLLTILDVYVIVGIDCLCPGKILRERGKEESSGRGAEEESYKEESYMEESPGESSEEESVGVSVGGAARRAIAAS